MTITNEPIIPGEPVKFQVLGFPEETAIKSSIERFYGLKSDAERNFLVFNSFKEQIFSGSVNGDGKIENFTFSPRPGKSFESKPQ